MPTGVFTERDTGLVDEIIESGSDDFENHTIGMDLDDLAGSLDARSLGDALNRMAVRTPCSHCGALTAVHGSSAHR